MMLRTRGDVTRHGRFKHRGPGYLPDRRLPDRAHVAHVVPALTTQKREPQRCCPGAQGYPWIGVALTSAKHALGAWRSSAQKESPARRRAAFILIPGPIDFSWARSIFARRLGEFRRMPQHDVAPSKDALLT